MARETKRNWLSQFETPPSTESIWKLQVCPPTYNRALKNVMLTLPKQNIWIPMYIGTIKSQTAFVRYSLLRIEVDQKSHWQETAAVEPANSSHASIYCFVVTTRVCSYFWKSSDLMPICHLYLADILNHVSSTSCLHHCLHHKISCEPIWALFRDLCHLLICVVWWAFHDGSAHDRQ